MDIKPENLAQHNALMHRIYGLRGAVINEHIMLERMIDFYLSNTFAKDKKTSTELRDWVFTERINFESKIQILRLTISSHNPEFDLQYPKYGNDLIEINQKRNILGHHLFINDDEAIELYEKHNTYSFAKFKTDSSILYLTNDEVKNLINLISKYVPIFMELAGYK
jgi:hypothetical protein